MRKSAGTNKTTEWSGSGRVVAGIAEGDVIRWPGAAEAEERGWYRREPVDANRVATGQRTLKRAKPYCASTGFAKQSYGIS